MIKAKKAIFLGALATTVTASALYGHATSTLLFGDHSVFNMGGLIALALFKFNYDKISHGDLIW